MHVSWNNASVNKNSSTLLSYCSNKAITINYPNQPTNFPHNSYPSVLDIALSQRCTTSKPQSVKALSFDHNSIVFKVHLHPGYYDYKHANWPLFRYSLDTALDPHSPIQTTIELDHAITTSPSNRQLFTISLCILSNATTSCSRPTYAIG